jgi:DNA-binding SARP family transcriptional activator/tetratricopeptide (TPR) repeat protein
MIRLRTFGLVALERDGMTLTGRNTQRRRLALLVLLACARRKPVSRDRLLGLLWSEREVERGRHALAQLVYELRRDLGASIIAGGTEDLFLDSTAITSDAGDFEEAFQQGAMQQVATLHSGAFLDGFFVSGAPEFERWAEERRREYATKYLHALETQAVVATDSGDFLAAAEYRRRAAALDPLSARHAAALMRSLARAGDRPAAIRHAQIHARLLRGELNVDPDPSVMQLAAELSRMSESQATGAPYQSEAVASVARSSTSVETDTREIATQPATSKPETTSRWRPSRIRARVFVPALAIALLLLGTALWRAPLSGRTSTPRIVVLGDIASSDSVMSLAAREIVRAELERTPDVVVVSDAAMASTMRLMKATPTTRLSEPVADDVAARSGVPLVVVGRIAKLANGIEIVARVIDVQHASSMAVLATRSHGEADVVPSVARLATELHDRITRAEVSTTAPLPAVTTSSLEALRAYTLARAALARVDRPAAIAYGEAAVAHDSDFALAHYLLGDLFWYVDQEHRAEQHLRRAFELSDRLPVREQLAVRARYTQLVLDRPDSALGYWRALRAAYPGEPLGYEGAVWDDLAIGAYEDAAAAADSALRLDSTAAPQVRNRMLALVSLGDTTRALTLTRGVGARWPYLEQQVLVARYLLRGDLSGLRLFLDSIAPPLVSGRPNLEMAPLRQPLLLSLGHVEEARAYADVVVARLHAQFALRAELLQAFGEISLGGSADRARRLLRAAITRLDSADLSPPATARLAEMAAGVAAMAGDRSAIGDIRRIVARRDAGRGLRSHSYAQITISAADAFTRGDYENAARLLDRTQKGRFFGRSQEVLALLDAEALERTGNHPRADSLFRFVAAPGGRNDVSDVWLTLRPVAIRALERSRLLASSRLSNR